MLETQKKKYRKNFITQVICQLTFDKNEQISEVSLKEYKNSLGAQYAELSTIKQQGVIIESSGSKVKSVVEDSELWQIESADKSHTITITMESFAISHSKYIKFRDYIGIIEHAQNLFFEKFNDTEQVNRVGLRFINQVAVQNLEHGWSQYIVKSLASALDFTPPEKLRRSMHSLIIQETENIKINFNYGVFNEYFPAPVLGNEFILDYDAYTDSPQKVGEFSDLIESFDTAIAIYFERSITDDLRDVMEVVEDGTEAR